MVLTWRALCAALLPIALREIPHALHRFLDHLSRHSEGNRERRAAQFYRHLQEEAG
jgi:hypothetical protein